jgi:hypothetical protein
MRSCVRFSFLALLVSAIVAVAAPAAQASFGISRFFAANCNAAGEKCGETANPNLTETEAQGFTQAGGHPNFGVTDFTVKTNLSGEPEGKVSHVRTDVAPGVSTNPEAVPKCTFEQFGAEVLPNSHLFTAPACPAESKIGVNKVTAFIPGIGPFNKFGPGANFLTASEEAPVFNLVQPPGLASDFGVAVKLPKPVTEAELKEIFKGSNKPVEEGQYYAHTLIEGNVEWAGDYHDYFEIAVSTALPLIRSRLSFTGNIGTGVAPYGSGGFLTNPTSCNGPGAGTTSKLTLKTEEGATVEETYTALVGSQNCGAVPFNPTFALTPETAESDQPDGITTELGQTHNLSPNGIDASQTKTASVTLPEGMTLNPSAAAGLEACSPAQARITSRTPGVACPAASKIGTVTLHVPGLPASEPLEGSLYLGGPESGPITGPPYNMYIDAESARYGVSVRLKGSATPNEATGQVRADFAENPEQPFSNLILKFNGGALAPIANPLACGTAATSTILTPFSGTAAFSPAQTPFVVDSNGTGGACAKPIAFSPPQATANSNPHAGGHTNYTFNLERPSGHQYVSEVKTTLPAGLVGTIPAAKQCSEVDANAGTCTAESLIGSASAIAGAGPKPFTFLGGRVYLTGPYNGAPFGLSIVVPAIAGPFNLGNVVTRAKLDIDQTTARVTASSVLPRVHKGVALRLRNVSVSINKANFLYNPTSCSALATNSTLVGFVPGSSDASTATLSTPFQLDNCNALKFKPGFKASTSSKTSKANGASLTTTVTPGAGQANIKSVKVSLPKALPSRLTTLQKACTEAQFAKDPMKCPSGSFVGGATVVTPTLPGKMTGPAILVSHGGAAFPDLDLVVQGSGVRVILVGNTDIKNGITTTTFASTPDVPVTGVTVNLPIGSHSALAANGNLCANKLVMPTTITGQNGVVVKQNTVISVANCGVRVVGHKAFGNTAFLTLQTYGAGRLSAKGSGLATTFRRFSKAQKNATLKVSLSRRGRGRHRPFKVRVRVGFVPKAKGAKSSASFVTVSFR